MGPRDGLHGSAHRTVPRHADVRRQRVAGSQNRAQRDLLPVEPRTGSAAKVAIEPVDRDDLLRRDDTQSIRGHHPGPDADDAHLPSPGAGRRTIAAPASAVEGAGYPESRSLTSRSSALVSKGWASLTTKCCSPASSHSSTSFGVVAPTLAVLSIS